MQEPRKTFKTLLPPMAVGALAAVGVLMLGLAQHTGRTNPTSDDASLRAPETPVRPVKPYGDTLAAIESKRQELAASLRRAASRQQRRVIIDEARREIFDAIYRRIVPYWYGTRWAFEGTTQRPGEGSIACGYFVATVLRDAGFRVERVRLAQQAAEIIIKSLTSEPHIRRFRNTGIQDFVEAVHRDGQGVYVVGLDYHVGLLVCEPPHLFFIHSSGLEPWCVVKEPAMTSPALVASRYRVYGKITADDELIERWVLNEPIPTRG